MNGRAWAFEQWKRNLLVVSASCFQFIQDDDAYGGYDEGAEDIIDFKRGPAQKPQAPSRVESSDLAQLGLIRNAEDQKIRDGGLFKNSF